MKVLDWEIAEEHLKEAEEAYTECRQRLMSVKRGTADARGPY